MNRVSLKVQRDAENNFLFFNDSIVMTILMVTVNVLLSSVAWSVLSTFICILSFDPHNGAMRWALLLFPSHR